MILEGEALYEAPMERAMTKRTETKSLKARVYNVISGSHWLGGGSLSYFGFVLEQVLEKSTMRLHRGILRRPTCEVTKTDSKYLVCFQTMYYSSL
jgi:hypothetical protein